MVAKVGNIELAEAAVILALPAAIALVTPEIRQQLALAPAGRAKALPVIEAIMVTANEDQAVDRR